MRHILFLTLLMLSGTLFSQQPIITPIGPEGGIISFLKGSTSDDVVFAVVQGKELFRSSNGGDSWNKVVLPIANSNSTDVYSVTLHPYSSDTVYVTTSAGLVRSVDKGISWTVNSNIPYPKYSLVYAIGNPNVVFGSDEAGVMRSNDGGKTWQPLKDNVYFGNRTIYRIAVHPFDQTNFRIVASTGFHDSTGLFFSSNSGQNWKPFNKGLISAGSRKIYSVEIDTTGMGKIDFRVIAGTSVGLYGMQTDQFDSVWQQLKMNPIDSLGVTTCGAFVYDKYDPQLFNPITQSNGQHIFSLYVGINSSEFEGRVRPTTVLNGLFKIDSRYSTITISPPVKRIFGGSGDVLSVFVPSATNKGKIYLGTTGGIFISVDSGQTWIAKNNGIQRSNIRNLTTISQNQSTTSLIAGVFGGGVYRSLNDGVSWSAVNTGLANSFVSTVASDKRTNTLYAGTPLTLYRSTNNGVLWNPIFQVDSSTIINKGKFSNRDNEMTIRISPKNSEIIIFHSQAYGMFISKDGAKSWGRITMPVSVDSLFAAEHFQFDPIDSSTIYFAGTGLFKSTNLGQSWIDISGNLPKKQFVATVNTEVGLTYISPVINPINNQEIFLSSLFHFDNGLPHKLFKTTDGGGEWNATDISSYNSVFDNYDVDAIIASGPKGIYRSLDRGISWKHLSDSSSFQQYFLVNAHPSNQNTFYLGSDNGAFKMLFNELPKFTIDTSEYFFGSIASKIETTLTIPFRNVNGTKKLIVNYVSLGDTVSFKYLGPRRIEIPSGADTTIDVKFIATSVGFKTALLRFESNDPDRPILNITLRGHSFGGNILNGFVYDFGSVTVGKDSTLSIIIDNSNRLQNFTMTFQEMSGDTSSFEIFGAKTIIVDSNKSSLFSVKFNPRSVGEKTIFLRFLTSDPKFPSVAYRFKGVGIAKNFISRRILIETSNGFSGDSGISQLEQYQHLASSLHRADMILQNQKTLPYTNYNSVVFVSPITPFSSSLVDSLQRYIVNGGTIVLVGDTNRVSSIILSSFLRDSSWVKKYSIRTGVQFNSNVIIDSLQTVQNNLALVAARPLRATAYSLNVDSIISFLPSSLSVDTSINTVIPLFGIKSTSLYAFDLSDSSVSKISNAIIAAVSLIGKGKIVVISDQDIWRNNTSDDTTVHQGIFAANNLRLALNIFGLIDNLAARLPESTPQEAYSMFAVPYTFADSSVEALFKDLGPPNKLLWRLFGKYNQRTGYAEFPDDFKKIRRGEGYWIITKDKKNITFGTTTVQGTENDFEIVLHPGYNMIGNPFPYDVSWKNSFVPDSVEKVIWSFENGNYDSVTQTMEKFRGYWIKNNGKLFKTIKINSAEVSTTLNKEGNPTTTLAANEWKMQIVASSKNLVDKNTYVGVLDNAKDGLDVNDFSKPPSSPSKYISISSKHPDSRLAADYRSRNESGYFWDFEIQSSESTPLINLNFTKFGSLPPNFNVFILDNKQERVYDIGQLLEYTLQFEKGEKSRSIRLIVGTREFAENNTHGIPFIPLEYLLLQNFPNPFNPTTTIQYSLSHSADTKLEIFNILGQKVKTLVNEHQKIGTYSLSWDGTNEEGMSVSSGMYYYRLKANNFHSVKKMTFVK